MSVPMSGGDRTARSAPQAPRSSAVGPVHTFTMHPRDDAEALLAVVIDYEKTLDPGLLNESYDLYLRVHALLAGHHRAPARTVYGLAMYQWYCYRLTATADEDWPKTPEFAGV